jgi:hypothetical protein
MSIEKKGVEKLGYIGLMISEPDNSTTCLRNMICQSAQNPRRTRNFIMVKQEMH